MQHNDFFIVYNLPQNYKNVKNLIVSRIVSIWNWTRSTSTVEWTSVSQKFPSLFCRRTIFNPSSVFERKEKEEFNVILPTGLLTFDTSQLGKVGAVKFEFKGK